MTATAHLGLTIKQGATFREPLTRTTYPYPVRVECGQVVKECGTPAPDTDATPEDYTGCAARAQIRPSIDSAAIIAELLGKEQHRARTYAAEADEARAAGLTCERAYDAARQALGQRGGKYGF